MLFILSNFEGHYVIKHKLSPKTRYMYGKNVIGEKPCPVQV